VRVEPRSNNAIAAGLSTFDDRMSMEARLARQAVGSEAFKKLQNHQESDFSRRPEKARPTGKMRAKDRPLANDFVSDEEFDRLLAAWFGNMARVLEPGRAFYIWGGYSPDFNPIEMVSAKLKNLFCRTAPRTVEALWNLLGNLLDAFSADECRRCLRHCGHAATAL